MAKKELSKKGTSRKRANAGKPKPVESRDNLNAINQMEANLFQKLIQVSNQYAKLVQQRDEFETILAQVKVKREKVAKGEIELPIMLPLGKNKFYHCNNKKDVLEDLDAEIKVLSNAVKGINGQMQNMQDAYVEAGLAVRDFTDAKFSKFRPKNTYSAGCSPKKSERVLFEGELDDIMKDEEKKEKMKEALKTAKKENKKLEASKKEE